MRNQHQVQRPKSAADPSIRIGIGEAEEMPGNRVAIPARLRVGIRFAQIDGDPTSIAIVFHNAGGSDMLHLHVRDVHIFQRTARFLDDVPSLPAGTSSSELRPHIIEYPQALVHDMAGAMYEATQASVSIRNNEAFDYQGEARFYDVHGKEFRALWRYTFFPKRYFIVKNPPVGKYPDQNDRLDPGPFLIASEVGIERVAR